MKSWRDFWDSEMPYFSTLLPKQKEVIAKALSDITKSEWKYYHGSVISPQNVLQEKEKFILEFFEKNGALKIADYPNTPVYQIRYDKFLELYNSKSWILKNRDCFMQGTAYLSSEQKEYVSDVLKEITGKEWRGQEGLPIISVEHIGEKAYALRPLRKKGLIEFGVSGSGRVVIALIDYNHFMDFIQNDYISDCKMPMPMTEMWQERYKQSENEESKISGLY